MEIILYGNGDFVLQRAETICGCFEVPCSKGIYISMKYPFSNFIPASATSRTMFMTMGTLPVRRNHEYTNTI